MAKLKWTEGQNQRFMLCDKHHCLAFNVYTIFRSSNDLFLLVSDVQFFVVVVSEMFEDTKGVIRRRKSKDGQ